MARGPRLGRVRPVSLRPQGHDIIRTWAFYTLLRVGELTDERPWDEILINGMVFGPDGNKMSKSRGNVVTPTDAVAEYGADSVRQALVLGGQPGSDVQFQPKEATSASRFLTKVWNIFQFSRNHFDEKTPEMSDPAYRDADRWILSRLSNAADSVADDMEAYRYDRALRTLREFVWDDLADDYLELVKGRLYEGRPGERNAARHALYTCVSSVVEDARHRSRRSSPRRCTTISPVPRRASIRPRGPTSRCTTRKPNWRARLSPEVASEVRAWKSDEGMALNGEINRIELYDDTERHPDTYDLSEAVNGPVYLEEGRPNVELAPVGVDPDHSSIGPKFRDKAGAVIGALESTDPAELQAQLDTHGEITLDAGGEEVTLDGDWVEIEEEYRAESGEEVEVLETEHATVLVFP